MISFAFSYNKRQSPPCLSLDGGDCYYGKRSVVVFGPKIVLSFKLVIVPPIHDASYFDRWRLDQNSTAWFFILQLFDYWGERCSSMWPSHTLLVLLFRETICWSSFIPAPSASVRVYPSSTPCLLSPAILMEDVQHERLDDVDTGKINEFKM